MTKDEKILKEGLEKPSENQDNMNRKSVLAFCNSMGCLLSLATKILRFYWPIIGGQPFFSTKISARD